MSVLADNLDPQNLALKLDEEGFVCIENAISSSWIASAQSYVHELVEQKGRRYFSLNWPSRNIGTPPQVLTDDPAMRRLMTDLARTGCPQAKLDDEIYNTLRVVAGASGDNKSLLHHYDKYVITALAPILIPEGEPRKAGELIIFPNRRGYRKLAMLNVAEKAVVQSDWYQKRFTSKLPEGDLPQIKYLKPGNLYLFWGYRSYHSNFPVAHDMVRATLLLHHGDPHPDSLVLKAKKALQVHNEHRILAGSTAKA